MILRRLTIPYCIKGLTIPHCIKGVNIGCIWWVIELSLYTHWLKISWKRVLIIWCHPSLSPFIWLSNNSNACTGFSRVMVFNLYTVCEIIFTSEWTQWMFTFVLLLNIPSISNIIIISIVGSLSSWSIITRTKKKIIGLGLLCLISVETMRGWELIAH